MQRHIITGEYPPDRGGVAGHSAELATGLALAGEDVHVWCRGDEAPVPEGAVTVHRAAGTFSGRGLDALDTALSGFPAPRRLLVQWVPHAFGRRSMNVAFCRWVLRRRRRHGDTIEVMVHEPGLPFRGRPGIVAAAAVHRLMAALLIRSASQVWVATPAWTDAWKPFGCFRQVPFEWLPIAATIPPAAGRQSAAAVVRARLLPSAGGLIGSFASGDECSGPLGAALLDVLRRRPEASLLLLGRHGASAREALAARTPRMPPGIHLAGPLEAAALSAHVSACDVICQWYPDGVCTRHSTAMNALAHGIPLVANPGRFTEPLWAEARAVAFVQADDPGSFVATLERLLNDPIERAGLAVRGRDLYEARFHMRHTVAAILGAADRAA